MWPAWIDITLGGLGVSLALWSLGRRRAGRPMHPDAAKADVWLLVFAILMIGTGAARWPG